MDEVIRIPVKIANCYLVKGDRCYLVDTGMPKSREKLAGALQEHGVRLGDLTHILITHYHNDHTGSLAWLQRESGAVVVAGAGDAPYIRGERPAEPPSGLSRLGRLMRKLPRSWVMGYQKCEGAGVDVVLSGGENLDELGLEVIALPGHTYGGMGFVDRPNRRAFVGDMVANYLGRIGTPVLSASYSLEEIEASMRALAGLDLEYMYPGHGKVIGPGASEKAAAFIKKRFG